MDTKSHLQKLPAAWLLALIAGLPLFSETVYTPSLPDIAHALKTSDALVEWTLTIYLIGFALGTLFWGRVSDRTGRKPSLLAGFAIYIVGCLGCYLSNSIEMLMVARLIQALGGSAGSVLSQAITRDAFHGSALGKMFATVGIALSVFPAIGPVFGGFIDQYWGWSAIFLALMMAGFTTWVLTLISLPETHAVHLRTKVSVLEVASKMLRDRRVLGFCWLIGGVCGIGFSYFAEGPFILIELLGLSPSVYGLTLLGGSCCYMAAAMISRRLHNTMDSQTILGYGLSMYLVTTTSLVIVCLCGYYFATPKLWLAGMIVTVMSLQMFAHSMTVLNAMALALQDYKWATGTASSLFGGAYYGLSALLTFGMGALHNGTIIPMPFYFFVIGLSMFFVFKTQILTTKAAQPAH